MPTYDYLCSTCGATFEFVQSMKDEPLILCPESICQQASKGAGKVNRMISGGTGVIYKGQGFYLTDYVHNKSEKSRGAGDAEKAGIEKPATTSSEPTTSSATNQGTDSSATTPVESNSATKTETSNTTSSTSSET
jgi:putative FmdB family regulatory protein